jgi:2-C-methyl-D-erythritol 4-phosphate cytidylyltransferase
MNGVERRCWAVVPAAGIGSRMETQTPKQYLQVAGATLLEHSIGVLLGSSDIAGVIVALHPEDRLAPSLAILNDARVQQVIGAQVRAGSVLAALDALAQQVSEEDWVLVHDAARPCLRSEDLGRLIAQVIATDCGGLLAEPVVDTVKQASQEGRVIATLDRSDLWRAQTPQMFRLGELRAALRSALSSGEAITDEASAMERAGHSVQLVSGCASNLKVTVPADLPLAAWYLKQQE